MTSVFFNESFLTQLAVNMLLAAGLYPMVATGQLSLGQAGFMAVGAYAAAWANVAWGWPLIMAIPVGILGAAAVAVPVSFGASRIRGLYLIIGTLAFGELVRIALSKIEAVGGVSGYYGIDALSLWAVWLCAAAALVLALLVMRSRVGLAMRAIREDEDAAESAGVSTRALKIWAVVAGAALTGLAGGLSASTVTVIKPEDFDVVLSIDIALYVLIGGSDTLAGPLVGAFLLTYLPEALGITDRYSKVLFGVVLIALMIVSPRGLVTRDRLRRLRRLVASSIRKPRVAYPTAAEPPSVPTGACRQPPGDPVFEARGLEKRYAGVIAVRGVGLQVNPGEIVGLIGPNGAGKTTLVNLATGLVPATGGAVVVGGNDVSRWPAHRRTKAGLSRTFQDVRLFPHLTVGENLAVAAGVARDSIPPVPEVLARFELLAEADRLPTELAYGIQRRVQVARALCSSPVVVFLDEPSIGLNRTESQSLADTLRSLREDGTALVVIDHNLDLVMGLAHRIVVLDHGEILSEGTPADVKRDPQVQAAYLGTPHSRHAAGGRRRTAASTGPALLEVDDLVMWYGPVEALGGVSLRVPRGDTVAVIGPNGAGKSSLLRTIFGLTRPAAGSIRFDGVDLIGREPNTMARAGIAYVPEQRAILGRLSVRENLDVAALGARVPTADQLDEVFHVFPLLEERADTPAAALSGGQQQMLSIGRGLMANPTLLMLDEPSLGLAPAVVDDVYAGLARLQERGLTILLVEQNVRRAMSLAARGYLMRLGRVEMDADAEAILTDDRLLTAYLGEESAVDPAD